MKYFYLFIICIGCLYSCSIFDDETLDKNVTNEDEITLETEQNISQFIETAKVIKELNQHVLALALQYPALGTGIISKDDIVKRSNACPNISPDPNQKSSYPQEFILNLDSEGNGCTPLGSKVKYKGTIAVNIISPALQKNGAFTIKATNLLIGENLDRTISKVEMEHVYQSNDGEQTIFDTKIKYLDFTNFSGSDNSKTVIQDVSGGKTIYRDVAKDTNLNDLSTILDDEVIFSFDKMFVQNQIGGETTLFDTSNGTLHFSIFCACPTDGTFKLDNLGGLIVDFKENSTCTDGAYNIGSLAFKLNCN